MPFTGSHPAAVLPFARWLPFPALAVGSMSPDAFYYLPLPVPSTFTHSLPGVLTVDLVTGLVAYGIWAGLLWPWLLALWPALAARTGAAAVRRRPTRVPGAVAVPVAVVVGGLTHIVWDAFTHPDRWGTHHLSVLTTRFAGLEGYRWAQYASGLVGALALAASAVVWWRRWGSAPPSPSVPTHPRAVTTLGRPGAAGPVLAVVIAALAGFGAAGWTLFGAHAGLRQAVFDGATRGGGAGAAAVVAAAVIWRVSGRPGHPGATAAS